MLRPPAAQRCPTYAPPSGCPTLPALRSYIGDRATPALPRPYPPMLPDLRSYVGDRPALLSLTALRSAPACPTLPCRPPYATPGLLTLSRRPSYATPLCLRAYASLPMAALRRCRRLLCPSPRACSLAVSSVPLLSLPAIPLPANLSHNHLKNTRFLPVILCHFQSRAIRTQGQSFSSYSQLPAKQRPLTTFLLCRNIVYSPSAVCSTRRTLTPRRPPPSRPRLLRPSPAPSHHAARGLRPPCTANDDDHKLHPPPLVITGATLISSPHRTSIPPCPTLRAPAVLRCPPYAGQRIYCMRTTAISPMCRRPMEPTN